MGKKKRIKALVLARRIVAPGVHTQLLDPPWIKERGGGKIKRGAQRHYELLTNGQVYDVVSGCPLWNPADNSHLYCWYTNSTLQDALWLVDALGFRYIHSRTWAKPRFGIGQYARGQTEHMMLAVRGKALVLQREWRDSPEHHEAPKPPTVTTLIGGGITDWPKDTRGKIIHSAKPAISYAEIATNSPPPRLEIFATTPREGWVCYGKLHRDKPAGVLTRRDKRRRDGQ